MADNPFEIPQALRDVSEQNIKQAHAAYEQLMAFVTKAMDPWTGAMPANPMATVFKDVQGRAAKSRRRMPTQFSRWAKRSPRHKISKRF